MYVCMYVCIYIYICILCICICILFVFSLSLSLPTYMYIYICMHNDSNNIYIYVCMYIYIYISSAISLGFLFRLCNEVMYCFFALYEWCKLWMLMRCFSFCDETCSSTLFVSWNSCSVFFLLDGMILGVTFGTGSGGNKATLEFVPFSVSVLAVVTSKLETAIYTFIYIGGGWLPWWSICNFECWRKHIPASFVNKPLPFGAICFSSPPCPKS